MDKPKMECAGVPAGAKMLVGSETEWISVASLRHSRHADMDLQNYRFASPIGVLAESVSGNLGHSVPLGESVSVKRSAESQVDDSPFNAYLESGTSAYKRPSFKTVQYWPVLTAAAY
jgi:hypothetical protein